MRTASVGHPVESPPSLNATAKENVRDRSNTGGTVCRRHRGIEEAGMAKNKKKIEKPRRYRDGKTGRFVTKKFAKKHPKRTRPAW